MSLGKIINGIKKVACVGAAALAFGAGTTEAAKYKIERIPLPEPNANFSYPTGINEDGEVIGIYGKRDGPRVGNVYWTKLFLYKNDTTRELKLDPNYAPCPNSGRDIDLDIKPRINDLGDILTRRVIYRSDNNDFILDVSCDSHLEAMKYWKALNNKGDAIAYASDQAYLYSGGQKIGLGFRDNYFAINDNRQIVGYYGIFWENGAITNLKPQGSVKAMDINNNSVIIGRIVKIIGDYSHAYACMWENKDGEAIIYGPKDSYAYGINDREQIVGFCGIYPEDQYAFLYEKDKMRNLNDYLPENSDWERLERAYDINDKGQIIGYGRLKGEYWEQSFLMTPILLEGDLSNDGIVNLRDLSVLAEHWLEEK